MFSPLVFWLWFAGLIFLVAGILSARKEFVAAHGLDRLISLGRAFVASALATFGAEHLSGARFIVGVVPLWMPARLFWVYFVGVALLCAASSFVLNRQAGLAAGLLALMFFSFVLMIHIPNVVASWKNRILWSVAFRDLAFAGGALAFSANQSRDSEAGRSSWRIVVGRLCVAGALIFFSVEYFLHPETAPSVPLPRLTPAWVPLRIFWGYLTGAILLVTGAALLFNRKARTAATCVGVLMTLATVCLYLPIMAQGGTTSQLIESINYVQDTLLFAGMAFVLAAALPLGLTNTTRNASGEPMRNVVGQAEFGRGLPSNN